MPDPAPTPDLTQPIVDELLAIIGPLRDAATSPELAAALLRRLGWNVSALLGATATNLQPRLTALGGQAGDVAGLVASPAPTLDDVRARLEALGDLAASIGELAGALPPEAAALPADLVEDLFLRHLQRRRPLAYALLRALGLVEVEVDPQVVSGGQVVRQAVERPMLHLDRIGALLGDPVGHLRQRFLPAPLLTTGDAAAAAPALLGAVADVLEQLGVEALVGRGLGPTSLSAAREQQLAASMTAIRRFAVPLGSADVGATVSLVAADAGGPGLFLSPLGALQLEVERPPWTVTGAVAGAGVGGVLIRRDDVRLVTPGAGTELTVTVAVARAGEDEDRPAVLVGGAEGTRLEIGTLSFSAHGRFGADAIEYGVLAETTNAAIVVAAGDGDGFLQQVLPPDGLRAELDLAIGWSNVRGLHFRGSSSLDATLPVHVSLGPLSVPAVFLRVVAGDAGVELSVGATAALILGPVKATVERIGLRADLTFPSGGGNLGPADAALEFKPPNGAGLVIEAGPLTGGGYAFFDPVQRQYAGALQLEFKGLALKAVGIITTRLPDGTDGFSLLVIISAEFTPIQLGYGFTLSGVGGLVGINRTAAVEVLRAGIKNRTLDSIMFPADPVANAPQLVSNLNAVFPPAPGRFVVGPMARLGWGTPTLLTLDLGLLLELPAPVRLIVLGRFRMVLPHETAPVVAVNIDVIGIVDFERGEVSVDATLYDSTIAGYALTGDMALRAGWLDRPGFALSAGGFHPRFQPPPGFPALQRLALTLSTGDNPRLRLEAYLALTSNTAQFGARLELYAAAMGFSISGVLTFDALFQFEPFALLVEISGSVALRQGSRQLMSVTVNVSLSGPTPWRARGLARFELLFLDAEVRFDVRFGKALPPPPSEPVDVEPLVEAALADPRNWSAQLPPEGESLVSLREIPRPAGTLLVHPLATVSVSQRVAPLGHELARYGSARISGRTRMDITALVIGGRTATGDVLAEQFAPAQFLDMTDDEKLSRPSFERWEAGRRVRGTGVARDTAPPEEVTMERETIIVDDPDRPGRQAVVPTTLARAVQLARSSPAARAPTRTTGAGRFAGPSLLLEVEG